MNIDICKLLSPSKITVFQNVNCIQRKNLLLSGCRGNVVLGTKRKLGAKYPTGACEMKSLTCSLLPPLCQDNDVFLLKLSFLTSNFY